MTARNRRLRLLAAVILVIVCQIVAGCTEPDDVGDRWPPGTAEAATFGDVYLPPGIEVLAAESDREVVPSHTLALRVTPAQLDELLAKSNFTEPRMPNQYASGRTVAAGPPLSTATDLRYAQDSVETDHGRVVREVFEDHRSPDEIYLHLTMFTLGAP